MAPRLRSLAIVLACGIMAGFVLTPPAAAQQRRASRPGRIFIPPYNPFLNYPLTPYMSVGQYLATQNTLAYAALFGRLPPGPNPFLNYPLTPYLGVGQAAGIIATLGGGLPGYSALGTSFSPLQSAFYGGAGLPYGGPGYFPIPYPLGYSPPYTSGVGATPVYGSSNAYANTQQLTTTAKPVNALDTLRKHGGGLDWPLGLRALEPKEESKILRQAIDDAVETIFHQPEGTDTTTKLLQQVSGQMDKLDRMYKTHVWDMALTRQQEDDVRRFVKKVRDGLVAAKESGQLHAQSQLTSGSQGTPKGHEHGPGEVGVYDNYFEPNSIEIAAGAKVRWKSHGGHQHTVTADKDDWLSLDLGPGTDVTVTFTKPGTYHYHCNIHPKEMRGTIIVK